MAILPQRQNISLASSDDVTNQVSCRCLGEGQYSQVFEARLTGSVTVAVKNLKKDTDMTAADFLQEAKMIRCVLGCVMLRCCIALHCVELCCVVLSCSVLHWVAFCCVLLCCCTALHYIVLCHVASCCIALHCHSAVLFCVNRIVSCNLLPSPFEATAMDNALGLE